MEGVHHIRLRRSRRMELSVTAGRWGRAVMIGRPSTAGALAGRKRAVLPAHVARVARGNHQVPRCSAACKEGTSNRSSSSGRQPFTSQLPTCSTNVCSSERNGGRTPLKLSSHPTIMVTFPGIDTGQSSPSVQQRRRHRCLFRPPCVTAQLARRHDNPRQSEVKSHGGHLRGGMDCPQDWRTGDGGGLQNPAASSVMPMRVGSVFLARWTRCLLWFARSSPVELGASLGRYQAHAICPPREGLLHRDAPFPCFSPSNLPRSSRRSSGRISLPGMRNFRRRRRWLLVPCSPWGWWNAARGSRVRKASGSSVFGRVPRC